LLTFIKAQSDDSESFEQLAKWGTDKSFRFSILSLSMYETIRRFYLERLQRGYFTCEWTAGIDPSKFSLADFKTCLSTLEPKYHTHLVNLIYTRNDLSKKDKLIFLIDVLNSSNSLNAKDHAGRFFATETNITWDPFNYKPLFDKWEETKDTIK